MVNLDSNWAYSGDAYWVKSDDSIAICGKSVNGNINESSFEHICTEAERKCSCGDNSCVRDEVLEEIKGNENICGRQNYGLLISKTETSYNGYTGEVKRVQSNDECNTACAIMCGGFSEKLDEDTSVLAIEAHMRRLLKRGLLENLR